jgi:hypothetical protein
MANYITFEYWNDTDLGETLYQFGYHNKLILNIEIEKPDYNTIIEAEQNGDNAPITKFRKLEKVRKWETFVQEDLVDAFKFMALHDNIEITLRSGEVLTVLKHTMVIEHSWEELGCLAKVTGSFVVDYIAAGSCNENFDLTCLCDDPGEFEDIIEYSELAVSNPAKVYLVWTVENIAGKKYTASLYYYSSGVLSWLPSIVPDQYSCYEDQTGGGTWIFDGQYWLRSPGYLILTKSGHDITVTGWCLPGAFITLKYTGGTVGDYTADELQTGITFTTGGHATYLVWADVWNHSCDYKSTETESIVIT